jgi:hypothetical protein
MHNIINNLISIEKEIQENCKRNNYIDYKPNIVAVSKTFSIKDVLPLINHGHLHFGENKIQEAIEKWTSIKNDFSNIKLHMIGKLQTNKVKYVIPLFDYIHSLDNFKLAEKIYKEEIKLKKKVKIFIQVNVADEQQKSGISIDSLEDFLSACIKDLNLNIIGLMCLPPQDNNADFYFSTIKQLNDKFHLSDLSLGMSEDYIHAIKYKPTYLRIGSKIFGERT